MVKVQASALCIGAGGSVGREGPIVQIGTALGSALGRGVPLALPEMYGVGYPVLGAAVAGHYGAGFLLVLLAGKVVATSLTIGIGGSGGGFAPSLFCGAMFGEAFGIAVHAAAPGIVTGFPGRLSGPPKVYFVRPNGR